MQAGCMKLSSRVAIVALCAVLGAACAGEPLLILVTNDDGVQAEGMDLLVSALRKENHTVVVVAPDGNRSGSSDTRGPSELCGDLSVITTTTRSGYPATAIDGCPADAVAYGLAELYSAALPHLLIVGVNDGPNLSQAIAGEISGTVGAAKTAARSGVPALAASQASPGPDGHPDFPAGVAAVVGWVQENYRSLGSRQRPPSVVNLNIPSCTEGKIRGVARNMPLALVPDGVLDLQDCLSTLEDPSTDVEALINGFISFGPVPFD